MKYTGKIHKFGADVDTDAIIPVRYPNTFDPRELAKHCMEDADPTFPERVQPGDIIVADKTSDAAVPASMLPSPSRPPGFPALLPAPLRAYSTATASISGLPSWNARKPLRGWKKGIRSKWIWKPADHQPKKRHFLLCPAFPALHAGEIVARGGLINYVKDKAAADNGQ